MAGYDRPAVNAATYEIPKTRRFSERARVSWTVWATIGHRRVRFHTVDVSARGAKLRPRASLQVGTALQLEFIKPDGRRLHVSGVVLRTDADGATILFLGTVLQGFDGLGRRI